MGGLARGARRSSIGEVPKARARRSAIDWLTGSKSKEVGY